MLGFRLKKHVYNEMERKQMPVIQDAFKGAFPGEALPLYLTLEPNRKEAKVHPHPGMFAFDLWSTKLDASTGKLKPRIAECIRLICAYQQSRYHDRIPTNNGYLDEPIQLACEHIKEEIKALADIECNEAAMDKIKQWITYFNLLCKAQCLLPENCLESPSRLGIDAETPTFYHTLLRLRSIFENKLKVTIELEMSRRYIRDYLSNIVQVCDDLVEQSFLYLIYLLREGKNAFPTNLTANSILNPVREVERSLVKTHAGQCLVLLAKTIRDAENDAPEQDKLQAVAAVFLDNPFWGEKVGEVRLPIEHHVQQTSCQILSLLRTEESGLAKIFRGSDDESIKVHHDFIFLHGLIVALLHVRKDWQIARKLSGLSGNVGVCGFGSFSLNNLLWTTKHLMMRMGNTIHSLNEHAHFRYEQLFAFNSNEELVWRDNFRFSWNFHDSLVKDLQRAADLIELIHTEANKRTPRELLQETEEALSAFDEMTAVCVRSISRHLGFSLPERHQYAVAEIAPTAVLRSEVRQISSSLSMRPALCAPSTSVMQQAAVVTAEATSSVAISSVAPASPCIPPSDAQAGNDQYLRGFVQQLRSRQQQSRRAEVTEIASERVGSGVDQAFPI